jgi:hypothetical protein
MTPAARTLRLAGALALLASGAIHLWLYYDDYGTDDLGNAFLANAALSAVIAAYIVLRPDHLGLLAGIALSVGTLVASFLSRRGDGILDVRETGLNPSPEALLSIILEVAAIILLAGCLVASASPGRTTSSPRS